MHHRWYNPRLGTFLTPDFRPPNIYDPSTFTEPYAYAAGNPIMYYDRDGLATDAATDMYILHKDSTPEERIRNSLVGPQLVGGAAVGLTKNAVLGAKDTIVLLARLKIAQTRISGHEFNLRIGLPGVVGIENDYAYIKMVNDAFYDLFVNQGIFQSMGRAAGQSAFDAAELLREGKVFEAGVASADLLEVIALMASLPKAGLAVSRSLTGKADDIVRNISKIDLPDNIDSYPMNRNFGSGFDNFGDVADDFNVFDSKHRIKELSPNALGEFGEAQARALLESRGYTDIFSIQNSSGWGVDLIGTNKAGKIRFFEVKTNTSRLSKAQKLGARPYVTQKLEEAVRGYRNWKNASLDVRLKAQSILDEINAGNIDIKGAVLRYNSLTETFKPIRWRRK